MTWVGFWPVPSQLSPALVTLPLTLPVALALTAGTTIGGWGVVLLTYLPGLHGAGLSDITNQETRALQWIYEVNNEHKQEYGRQQIQRSSP